MVVRGSLSDEAASCRGTSKIEQVNLRLSGGKRDPVRGGSQRQGPERGACLTCLRTKKEVPGDTGDRCWT